MDLVGLEDGADAPEEVRSAWETVTQIREHHPHGRTLAGSTATATILGSGSLGSTKLVPNREPRTLTRRTPSGVVTHVAFPPPTLMLDGGTARTETGDVSTRDPVTVLMAPADWTAPGCSVNHDIPLASMPTSVSASI